MPTSPSTRPAIQVDGGASPLDFDRWFVSATRGIDEAADPAADDRTGELYVRLAEHARGDRTEDELRAILRPLVVEAGAVSQAAPRRRTGAW